MEHLFLQNNKLHADTFDKLSIYKHIDKFSVLCVFWATVFCFLKLDLNQEIESQEIDL